MGLIRRVHGGAVPASTLAVIESGISERDLANTDAKDAIAAAAVALLPPPGSMIVIDAGSTTARFAALLPRDHRLTVVTHAVPVAARLAGLPHIDLYLLPGKVRPTTHAAVGADTVAALSDLRADVAFLATNGLSTTPRPDHPRPRRGGHQARHRRPPAGVRSCSPTPPRSASRPRCGSPRSSEVDVLVTDSGISDDDASALAAADVEVVIA